MLSADDLNNPHHKGEKASWFNGDCVHPNAAGHHGMRKAFFEAITGQTGP